LVFFAANEQHPEPARLLLPATIAGMPPLSGFVAKFAMIGALLTPGGPDGAGFVPTSSWVLVLLLVISGLAAMIAMLRAGINTFWVSFDSEVPPVRTVELAPVVVLLGICVLLTILAGPVMNVMDVVVGMLPPSGYVGAVLDAAIGSGT